MKLTVNDAGTEIVMYFSYDASGTPTSILYDGTTYYYVTNLQGDVVGIVNQNGNIRVSYTYDAWGNLLSTTGGRATTVGKYNPLRYRGYVYDLDKSGYILELYSISECFLGGIDMYKVKRVCLLFLIFTVLAVVAGCEDKPFQYTFRQDRYNVEKIEICTFDSYHREIKEPLICLAGDDIDAILSDLSSAECWRYSGLDSPRGYGDMLICIQYSDGEVEIIGQKNIGWITPNGEWHYTMYSFDAKDLYAILCQYISPDILAEVSEYF